MRRVRSRDTSPELLLRKALHARGLRFRLCAKELPGKPDIVFPSARLAVFVDGDLWHGRQWRRRGLACLEEQFARSERRDYWLSKIGRNMARDRCATADLVAQGWRILRFWESDLKEDLEGCVEMTAKTIDGSAPDVIGEALSQRTVAEFFAGIGLVRLGLDAADWRTVYANDIDAKKRALYQLNFGDDDFHLGDIHEITPDDAPTVALATASFPCTDLSLAGGRRGLKGKHSSAFWGFARILEGMGERRPPLVMIENVTGLLTSHGGEDFRELTTTLSKMGYWLDAFVLNASRFAPQSRPRLFIIGMRERDIEGLSIDEATERNPTLRTPQLVRALRAATDAKWRLAPLPRPPKRKNDLADILENVPEDSKLWWSSDRVDALLAQMNDIHTSRLGVLRRIPGGGVGTVFRRVRKGKTAAELRADGVAGCLRTPRGGSSRQILLSADPEKVRARLLTPRECARLQGVPDDYRLDGVRANQALFGLGDAVCSPAITWIARHVLDPAADAMLRGRVLGPVQ